MNEHVLERVLHLSRSMAETRALNPLLDYAIDEAMGLVGAKRGYVVLLKEDGSLDFRVMRGLRKHETNMGQDEISTSILRRVVEMREPLVIRDARSDSQWQHVESVALLGLRSVMCVPLIAGGQILGAIYVENRSVSDCFSEEDLPPLVLFANQAAVFIENARINDDLEDQVASRTRQLEKNWEHAVEVNRLRVTLLGNIAHDLRAPLSIIISSLQLTLDGTLGDVTADQLEWLGKALTTAKFLQNLAQDVLDIAKIEQGGLRLYPETVNLHELLTGLYRTGLALPWLPGVALQLDIPAELPTILLDPQRITQVVLNLLANALKFTQTGTVTLHAHTLPGEDAIQIGVEDTGEGIPQEKTGELFERFHQVDGDRQRRAIGTGLGLAICRDLVEMHGGRIWVESTPHEGSDFIFVLPLTPSPEILRKNSSE